MTANVLVWVDGVAVVRPATPADLVSALPTLDDYQRAVQRHVDAAAKSRGYDSAATCASYITSTVPLWAAEATAFVDWRDAVWVAVLARMAGVQAGQEPAPSIADLIADLPVLDWPEFGAQ